MFTIFLTIVFIIPLYGVLIWTYFNPEESIMFGNRWKYKEDPELSEEHIRYTKLSTLIVMVGLPIIAFSYIIDNQLLIFISVISFFMSFFILVLKIFK
ncbi:hypothetical protein [Bacillus solimangrovi]|uniref:DUF6199 domain-containing protein n=1 Tax=Bacillus solimangrovi TaxID=1305675 RepID=A0A1E5LIA4_9BACI|nr:hypothetical protein [Bacillus solimangrovi]OEH93810.1 hypothetical protein BFG57_10825 [Bacillus solimangrovi]